jgi:hypothetical protein
MLRAFYPFLVMASGLLYAPVASSLDLEPWMTERRIIGDNNLEPIEQTRGTHAYDFSQAVARVEVMEGYGFCTGARVGEDLFLSNYHCDIGCDTTVFRLGYESDIPVADRTTYRCVALIRKNELLDYALFAVEPTPQQGTPKSYPILSLSRTPAIQNMRALLASHPTGRMKVVDRSQECVISDANVTHTDSGRDTIKHTCDTEGGSSGAPVIDFERGTAIGLHWGGKANEFNYAIPMTLILDDLEANIDPSVFSRLQVSDH